MNVAQCHRNFFLTTGRQSSLHPPTDKLIRPPSELRKRKRKIYADKASRRTVVNMNVPHSTRYYRLRGRPTRDVKSANQQYLTNHEEAVLWKFIVDKEHEMGGKRIRNEEIRLIAQHIRRHRHSNKDLRNDESSSTVGPPNKNWAKGFFDRQAARGMGFRGDKSAANNRQEIDPWLPAIDQMLHATKILDENIFHVIAVGGTMPYHADPRTLATTDSLEDFTKRRQSAAVVTVVECVSQSGILLSPFIVWPKSTGKNFLDQAASFHFANLVLSGRLEEASFFHWLQHVFEPHTCVGASGRERFLLVARTERFHSERIQKFCRARRVVLCEADGAPCRKILPDVNLLTSRIPTIVKALQETYKCNKSLGMGFMEGYDDARTQAFVESGNRIVDAIPHQASAADAADEIEPGPMSESEMPTAAAFEQLLFEVQHDLACLDIDREERDVVDRFITTAKMFASFYFKHSAKGP